MEPITFRFNGQKTKDYYIEPRTRKKIKLSEKSKTYWRSVVSFHEILDDNLNKLCDTQLIHSYGKHSSTTLLYLSAPKKTCKLEHSEGIIFYTSQHMSYVIDEKE